MSTSSLRQLGRYELLRRVAAGGMGEIFLARMRGAGGFEKRVIIKTILPHLAEEEEFVEKFLDEGRIVVQLTHGNIVPVFDMGEEHGEFFIAMEYIPGRDLRDLIRHRKVQGESVDLAIALHIIAEVCKGLGYAHRKADEEGQPLELVHRDVSPSNVLISSEGEVKLIDFGIARATTKLSRTVEGRIQGKFNYMSPEQAAGKIVDARSDIFSTGVMLYEMLTGVRPFDGSTDLETLDLVRQCRFDAASTLNPLIPAEVDEIIERALCKELDDRYQSIDKMQADILSYLYREGCAPSSTDLVRYLDESFSGEIERGELRLGTPSSTSLRSEVDGPMRLDDILEAELAKLGGGGHDTSNADPFTRTDVSRPEFSARARAGASPHHTATLVTELEPMEPASGVSNAPEPPKPITQPPEKEPLPGTLEESTPLDSTPTEENEDREVGEDAKEEEAPHVGAASAGAKRPALLWPGLALLLASLIGIVFWFALQPPKAATLAIETEPGGAKLLLDGALMQDLLTPLEAEVTPGWHELELRREGHVPYRVRLQVEEGERLELRGPQAIKLEALPDEPAVKAPAEKIWREITVQTRPQGSTLLVDGEELGPSPQKVRIEEGRPVIVYAQREGCEDADVTLSHRYARDSYTISMLCRQDQAAQLSNDPAPAQDTPTSSPTASKLVSIMVRVEPSDAVITINGKNGRGVLTGNHPASRALSIQAYKKGYEPFRATMNAGELKRKGGLSIKLEPEASKCIDIRLMAIQMADDVRIDGRSIGPVKSHKRGIQVGPGKHTIEAVNKVAGREDSTTITIPEDATSCVNAVLFPLD